MAESEDAEKSLKEIFDESLNLFNTIESSTLPQKNIQNDVKKAISLLEQCTNLINLVSLYSSNELIEEVSTSNVQYLAIPAMLGILVDKIQTDDRLQTIETCEIYLNDFLTRLKDYGVLSDDFTVSTEKTNKSLAEMAKERTEKIRKYQEQKELEKEREHLKKILINADEEVQRKYYLLFVKGFVHRAVEQLESLSMEKPFAQMRREGVQIEKETKKTISSFKPIIITRNEVQKKVFGAGYPSLPTMTVDEFYEQRVKEGIFPAHGSSSYAKSLQEMTDPEVIARQEENRELLQEMATENDDPRELEKAREMDEFKDNHRRGWGNRYNRS